MKRGLEGESESLEEGRRLPRGRVAAFLHRRAKNRRRPVPRLYSSLVRPMSDTSLLPGYSSICLRRDARNDFREHV